MAILLDICKFARKAPCHPILAFRELAASQWARFALIGFCASATYYLLGLLFVTFLHIGLFYGNTLAFLLSFIVSYFGQARWTFKCERPHREALPRFAAIQILGLLLNSFIIDMVCRRLRLPYPLGMLAAILIVPAATFIFCKFWVFRKK